MAADLPTQVGDDELVTLAEACRVFFGGRLTKSALRTEARKGNLEVIQIANKDFVTRNAIERMKQKCLKKSDPPGSGSERIPEHGSSKTEAGASARDALKAKLKQHKESSPNTSQASTSHSAAVIPLKSR